MLGVIARLIILLLKCRPKEITTNESCTEETRTKKIKLTNGKTFVPPYFNELAKPTYLGKKKSIKKKTK